MTDQTKEKKPVLLAPHLAVTHMAQGGAANGRNISLLLKSADSLEDPKAIALLEKVFSTGKDKEKVEIEKASYKTMRLVLEHAIKRFQESRYDYSWVHDFDESTVVFTNDRGLQYSEYTITETGVELTEPKKVTEHITYVPEEDLISIIPDEIISEGVRDLVLKSVEDITKDETLINIYKTKYEKEQQEMKEEIQKAVEAKDAELKAALDQMEVLKSELAEFKKEVAEKKQADRLEVIKSVKTDEAEAKELLKSLEALDDDSFSTVIKSLKGEQEKLEQSDLVKSVSTSGATVEMDTLSEAEEMMKDIAKARGYIKE